MKIPAWICTEERWHSRKNLIVHDGRGILEYGHGGWTFHAKNIENSAVTITDVELGRPVFPWIAQTLATLALYAVIVGLSFLADDPPFTLTIVASATVGLMIGFIVYRMQYWVIATGKDSDGNTIVGRFHDMGAFGWMGLLGGNRRLADALEHDRVKEQ